MEDKMYICPMDPDVVSDHPGKCPKCGMDLVLMEHRGENKNHSKHGSMEEDFKKRFFISLPLVLIIMLLSPNIEQWLSLKIDFIGKDLLVFVFATIIFFFGGTPFFKAAKGEIKSKTLGMMTLVALAITTGYFFSVANTFFLKGESLYWEISTLILVFLLGHWLEMRAVRGTTGVLSDLVKLIPQTAHKLVGEKTKDVETENLIKGDRVKVLPGEKIPIDALVLSGESSINESMITGESAPVFKKKGDSVIGGTLNGDGALVIEVTKTGRETAISQIMELIKNAQASKPNVQLLADKGAFVLTVTAIAVGLFTLIFWTFVLPHGLVFAMTLAVSVVVVTCPHALGLAIPTVTTITSTLGAKNGILIKDMKGLEIARKINYVVFDKTGTLTKGEFAVNKITTDLKEDELLSLAASIEANSQHSIAKGILNEAQKRSLKLQKVSDFKSYPGKGAEGKVNEKIIMLGNKSFIESKGIAVRSFAENSSTAVYLAVDKKLKGVIFLSDEIRDESREAVESLHKMGIKVAMLTGDKDTVAQKVGQTLAIDKIYANVLPSDKVAKIRELEKDGNFVAMVGDGVNDAASLAQSHLGIAIGAGTDVAIESAQIVLVKNDPRDVVKAISLSKKTDSKMKQNLFWATGYNILAIPTAAGVFYSNFGILLRPEWAAVLMSLSSIIVVFNALLLKRAKL